MCQINKPTGKNNQNLAAPSSPSAASVNERLRTLAEQKFSLRLDAYRGGHTHTHMAGDGSSIQMFSEAKGFARTNKFRLARLMSDNVYCNERVETDVPLRECPPTGCQESLKDKSGLLHLV